MPISKTVGAQGPGEANLGLVDPQENCVSEIVSFPWRSRVRVGSAVDPGVGSAVDTGTELRADPGLRWVLQRSRVGFSLIPRMVSPPDLGPVEKVRQRLCRSQNIFLTTFRCHV